MDADMVAEPVRRSISAWTAIRVGISSARPLRYAANWTLRAESSRSVTPWPPSCHGFPAPRGSDIRASSQADAQLAVFDQHVPLGLKADPQGFVVRQKAKCSGRHKASDQFGVRMPHRCPQVERHCEHAGRLP